MMCLATAIPILDPRDNEIEAISELNALFCVGYAAVVAPPVDQEEKAGLMGDTLRRFRHIAIDVCVTMLVTDVVLRWKRDRFDALMGSHRAS